MPRQRQAQLDHGPGGGVWVRHGTAMDAQGRCHSWCLLVGLAACETACVRRSWLALIFPLYGEDYRRGDLAP